MRTTGRSVRVVWSLVLLLGLAGTAGAQALRLALPTRNDALLRGDGPSFYQFTDRHYRGRLTHPWEGGQYGFVRNVKDTRIGPVYTRFHEGVDIRPLHRDARGEPLDTVRAIDGGTVVYTNHDPRASNYGKYVVVEHTWSDAPFYSLYAHLADVTVYEGQRLRRGDRLGRMGYTGDGIDRRRAHVHLEVNMLLCSEYEGWLAARSRRVDNRHGLFNGQNLAGLDVGALYLALRDDPGLRIEDFLARQDVFFKVTIPNDHVLDVLARYPFLARRGYDAAAPSVEIAFTRTGLPVAVEPSRWRVSAPMLSMVAASDLDYNDATNHLAGHRGAARLSGSGARYLDLLLAGGRPAGSLVVAPPNTFVAEKAAVLPPKPEPGPRTQFLEAQKETLEKNEPTVRGW